MSHSHSWAKRDGWAVCTLCGVVRNCDRPESPCRGAAKIALREAAGGEQAETAEMLELSRLRRELDETQTDRDDLAARWNVEVARCRTAAQILIEAIGAPGPESVEETARRAVATLEAWRYKAETTSEEAAKLRRDLGDVLAMRDEALTRCHTVARTLTDAIGASGFVSLEEAASRIVDALRAHVRVYQIEQSAHHATLTDAHRFREERDAARGELEEVRAARDDALVKLECLDDHRRADSELIDRLEYALRAMIDSVTASKCRDTIVLRDIEAARALVGEGRS